MNAFIYTNKIIKTKPSKDYLAFYLSLGLMHDNVSVQQIALTFEILSLSCKSS